jgi:amino acid adenylation domain-containing protein
LSFRVLNRDIVACYAAGLDGQPADLPPADLPPAAGRFAAHARRRHERHSMGADDAQLDYWKRALDGVPPAIELPLDHARPATQTHRGHYLRLTLPVETSAGVRALCRRTGATHFIVLLAAFAATLQRYTGQQRFAVGTLLSGRTTTESEDIVGLFANTVALPADLTGRPSFAELARRLRTVVFAALPNQDVAFEQVVDAVSPERELSRNPIFQVLFQHETADEGIIAFPGLRTEAVDVDHGLTKVDLSLETVDDGERIHLALGYAEDLFERATAERILESYRLLLEDAIARPDTPVTELEIISAESRARITRQWNATQADYPADRCLHELIADQARWHPEAVAVVAGDRRMSYRELDAQANRVAQHLRATGVRRGDFVGICMEHSADLFVSLLGIFKAGAAYVPLDPDHPADRLAYLLSDTRARVVVTHEHLIGRLPSSYRGAIVSLDGAKEVIEDRPATAPATDVAAGDLAYVIYTSGSTGKPKGVMITHQGLNNYLWWAVEGYGLDGAAGAPMLGSIAFDLSIPNFFLPLVGGKSITVLPPDPGLEHLTELLCRPGDFSLLKITPAHLDVLRGRLPDGTRLDSVRTYVIGADEVRPETAAAWRQIAPNARLINEYGPTETVVGCSIHEIPADADLARSVPIGRPIANTQMYVLDENLAPVPIGVAGELYIGGDGVARGYLGKPGLTAGRFLPDPHSPRPGARFYCTGDLARFRPDGDLEFLGRIDHQVKIRGYRIELGEIGSALECHPSVAKSVVSLREDRPGIKQLYAYVVPAGPAPDAAELTEFLSRSLPKYMLPTGFVMLDTLPLSTGGKVDRRLLPAPDPAADRGAADSAAAAEARTKPERTLLKIWSNVLAMDSIGVHDNFFDLGGDSVLAIHMYRQAVEAGLTIEPRMIFQHQTVAELIAAAADARHDPAGQISHPGSAT